MAGLWGGGGEIKGSNKPKKRLPRETMGKDPSGGRGMSERGESRRGIKPKGNYSGNHRQPAVSSLSPQEVRCFVCLFGFFCRFRNTREQDPQNSQHSVAFNVLGEPSAKAVSGLNQRGKFPSRAPFSLELPSQRREEDPLCKFPGVLYQPSLRRLDPALRLDFWKPRPKTASAR